MKFTTAIFVLSLCLLVEKSEQGCTIAVDQDIHDRTMVGVGNCNGKVLDIVIPNAHRAYCHGTCKSKHYAVTSGTSKVIIKSCVPIPSNGQYDLRTYTNFNATCENGAKWELVNFEYVHATKCGCRSTIETYIQTLG
jgi:hypothetical protein